MSDKSSQDPTNPQEASGNKQTFPPRFAVDCHTADPDDWIIKSFPIPIVESDPCTTNFIIVFLFSTGC